MKRYTRIFSALTAAVMGLSLFAGVMPAQAEEKVLPSPKTVQIGDTALTADNSFGQRILDAAGEGMDSDSDNRYDGSAGVTDVVIEDGKATVSYYTPVPADLVLAFYSDDELEMYTSVSAAVKPAKDSAASLNQTYVFNVPQNTPEYYVVKAYLVGAAFAPLCEAFYSNYYTESITKARNSKTTDFADDRVLNLDEHTDRNFYVLRDETVLVTSDGIHNMLDRFDETTLTYHFSNADAQLSGLCAGDLVCYDGGTPDDIYVFTVQSVSQDGADVVIVSEETDYLSAFQVSNIQEELICVPDDVEPGETYGDGVTYLGMSEEEKPNASLSPLAKDMGDIVFNNGAMKFKWSSKEMFGEKEAKVGKGKFSGEFTGEAELEIEIESKVTIRLFTWEDDKRCSSCKISQKTVLSGTASCEAKGQLLLSGTSAEKDGLSVKGGVGIELSGKLEMIAGSIGFERETQIWIFHWPGKDTPLYKTYQSPVKLTGSLGEVKASVFLGLFAEVEVSGGKGNIILGFDASMKFGIQAKAGLTLGVSTETDSQHLCKKCSPIKLSLVGSCKIKVKLPKFLNANLGFEIKLADVEYVIGEYYYSFDYEEFGEGKCPHRYYPILVYVYDMEDAPLSDAEVTIDGTVYPLDETGFAKVFLPDGTYEVTAKHGQYSDKRTVEIETTQRVVEFHLGAEPSTEPVTEAPTEPETEPLPEKSMILYSGECGAEGDNVIWELDNNGTLWITGSGAMANNTFHGPWDDYASNIRLVIISDGVTTIGSNSFKDCNNLTSVHMPDSIALIESGAFYNCENLTYMELPEGQTKVPANLFYGCWRMKEVRIPDSVTSIDNRAFLGCSGLTEVKIPEGVTSIGDTAFMGCSSIEAFHLPDSLQEIGNAAFEGCSSAVSINIPDGITTLYGDTFSHCSSLTELRLPDSLTKLDLSECIGCTSLTTVELPDGLTELPNHCFEGCESLTGLRLPENLTSIGISAFSGCTSLAEITLPDSVTEIGHDAFSECTSLTTFTFPQGLRTIPQGALYACENLTSVTIPDSVTLMQGLAFAHCPKLEKLNIPSSLTKGLYQTAFLGCSGLTDFCVAEGNTAYSDIDGVLYDSTGEKLIIYPRGRVGAFHIPNSTTEIETGAFSGCTGLTSVTIPEGVTMLDKEVFESCEAMTSVSIPASVTTIRYSAFSGCSGLTDAYYAGTEAQWAEVYVENIPAYNDALLNANMHFNASASSKRSLHTVPTSSAATSRSARFTDLTPGAVYYLYSVADRNAEDPLDADNLLYINQYTADENGCISADFIPTREVEGAETFVMLVPESEPEPEHPLGDVDGSGTVNATDAAKVLIAAASIGAGKDSGLTDAQRTAADVNTDGSVNATDAAIILQYAAAVGAGNTDVKITDFIRT